MLPAAYRLPRPQFLPVKSRGQTTSTPLFILLNLTHPSSITHPRFGIVVSSKVAKLATDRNLLKRHLRHSLIPLLPRLSPQHDFLLLTKPALKTTTPATINKSLYEILAPFLN